METCSSHGNSRSYGGHGTSDPRRTQREKLFDYDDELGVKAGLIHGMKKSRYNGEDYGVITITTYAAPAT